MAIGGKTCVFNIASILVGSANFSERECHDALMVVAGKDDAFFEEKDGTFPHTASPSHTLSPVPVYLLDRASASPAWLKAVLCHSSITIRFQTSRRSPLSLNPFPVPEPMIAVPKLCLLCAVMRHTGMGRIHYSPTNGSCAGALLYAPLW